MFDEEVVVINEVEEVEIFVIFQFSLSNEGGCNLKKEQVDGVQDEGSDEIEDDDRTTWEDTIVDENENAEIQNTDEVSIESW